MIESLSVYRNSPDELGEYDEYIRRRRKNNVSSSRRGKFPKIKAIMAILGERRNDTPNSEESLSNLLDLLLQEEEGRDDKSLKVDKFFK